MEATIYLSGPMTGIEEYNYPEFARYSGRLRDIGLNVINPAENFGGRTDLPREAYLRLDFEQIMSLPQERGKLFLMPGWDKSDGSRKEFALAHSLGLRCFEVDINGNWLDIREVNLVPVVSLQEKKG